MGLSYSRDGAASLFARSPPLAARSRTQKRSVLARFWAILACFWAFFASLYSSSSLCGQKCLALYFFVHGGVLSSIALFDRPLESLLLVVGDGLSDGVTVSACEW